MTQIADSQQAGSAPSTRPANAPLSFGERLVLFAFIAVATVFSIIPVYNTIHRMHKGDEGSKDYPIWFNAGHDEFTNHSPYHLDGHNEFPFMYPPGAAGLLAPLSLMGRVPLVIFLVLLNSTAWATCILAPVYLLTGRFRVPQLGIYWIPSLICVIYIWDTYLEGQMAFFLSACLLAMLVFLKRGNGIRAGMMLAIAAGFKGFPIAALPYLIYRRHWKALASTCVWLIILLFLLPACFRGFGGARSDLNVWKDGMLASNTDTKMSPHGRGERSYTWQNGSVMGIAHRWLRHVKADTDSAPDESPLPPIYINVANLPLKTVNHIADAILLLLGVGYLLATPWKQKNRTALTDTAEGAMLLILVILACPLSFTYNSTWLMCGIAVALYVANALPRRSFQRTAVVLWLTLSLLPMILSTSTGIYWWRYVRTMGNTLLTDLMMLALLTWICRRKFPAIPARPSGAPSEPA